MVLCLCIVWMKKNPTAYFYPNSLDETSELTEEKIEPKQHFTQPPAHFTEASLVKTLEELGIGRPSTYAPTITTILGRRYIVKENKNLYVSELGEVVNKYHEGGFPGNCG